MHKVGQRHLQKKLVEAIENCLLDFDHQTFTDLTKRQKNNIWTVLYSSNLTIYTFEKLDTFAVGKFNIISDWKS